MPGKVSEQDRAVVEKAAALIAKSPELKPAAALRKLGIRSEERIKRLRSALKTPTAKPSPQVSKPAKLPKTSARPPTKTAALKVHGAADVNDAIVAPIPANRDSVSTAPFAPLALMVDAQFALWKNLMRWTPVGTMINVAISSNAAAWNLMVPRRP